MKMGRMLNLGYAVVKLFFRRNAPAQCDINVALVMIVACSLKSQRPLSANLPCILLSHSVRS